VTARYSLLEATAAERLGLAPRCVHLDTTSFPVDGRYHSDEAPEEQVVHITRGYSRDHRPDFNQVMLELMVEHHAGIPLLMNPLSGNSRETPDFGEAVRLHVQPLQTTSGLAYLVADSAFSREANLGKLAQTPMQWITRVPATWREAQAALAQADPPAMVSLHEGDRAHEWPST
jgi:transposase